MNGFSCTFGLATTKQSTKAGLLIKKIGTVKYPSLPPAIRPIPHSDSLLVPSPTQIRKLEITNEDSVE